MVTEPISKPCLQCKRPILQTRNNKSKWASIVFCDNHCRRVHNRTAEFDDTPAPDRIELPNPHVNWRPTKGKKNKPTS